ncbi:MAG: hypothetical protein AAGA96_17635, partial [Verrucomicrobiota bacterium]
ENVTLIWRGPGGYPAKLPQGVTVSRDRSIWEQAREDWISRLPEHHPGLVWSEQSQTTTEAPEGH